MNGTLELMQGDPSDAGSLRAAQASTARALVFLSHNQRPIKVLSIPSCYDQRRGSGQLLAFKAMADLMTFEQMTMLCSHAF